jgi:hypothetical protein
MQHAIPSANARATKLLGFRDWRIYFQTHSNLNCCRSAAELSNQRSIGIANAQTSLTGDSNVDRLDIQGPVRPKKNRPDWLREQGAKPEVS